MPGIKHLLECHCVLAIYRTGIEEPQNHKFSVYSKIDKSDKVVPKYIKCNNCETVHYVYDLCRSEIKPGKDQSEITVSIDDLSLMLPERLASLLLKTKVDLSSWEHIVDILDEKRWGESVVLKRDIIEEKQHVKLIKILSNEKFKIENHIIEDIIV